jgi:hypothetical protein
LGSGKGGELQMISGDGGGSGDGGDITVQPGSGLTGGIVTINSGAGSFFCGNVNINSADAGSGNPTADGGSMNISAGDGGDTSGDSGSVFINAGTTSGSGTDGAIYLGQNGELYKWPTDTPAANDVLAIASTGGTSVMEWSANVPGKTERLNLYENAGHNIAKDGFRDVPWDHRVRLSADIGTWVFTNSSSGLSNLMAVPVAGQYQVNAKIVFNSVQSTSGLRSAYILVGGVAAGSAGTIIEGTTHTANSVGNSYVYVEALTDVLTAGTNISLQLYHTAGTTILTGVPVGSGGTLGVDLNRLTIRRV